MSTIQSYPRPTRALQPDDTILGYAGGTVQMPISLLGDALLAKISADVASKFQALEDQLDTRFPSGLVLFDARQFDLKCDDTLEDMANVRAWTAAVAACSAAGGTPLVRASGPIRVALDPTYGGSYALRKSIVFSGVHNAIFDFRDARFRFDSREINTGYANVLTVQNSRNPFGHLGSIDWVHRPFAQGVITKGLDYIDINLDPGFVPSFNEAQRLEVYDRAGRNLYKILSKSFDSGADVAGWAVSYPAPGVMRISGNGSNEFLDYLAKVSDGDLMVATYRVYGGNGFEIVSCSGYEFTGRVLSTGGMAWRSSDSENQKVNLAVHAKPGDLISATADGLRSISDRGYLDVEATVRNTGDDPLNVGNDSYVVTAVHSARTFSVSYDFPYNQVKVGDFVVGVKDDDTSLTFGIVEDYNFPVITMDRDLPADFDETWQIVNLSALPVVTFPRTFVAEFCRGQVRVQSSKTDGHIRARDITNGVSVMFAPSLYGEGGLPVACSFQVDAEDCTTIASEAASVSVFAYQLDGGGYGAVGALRGAIADIRVRGGRNSAVFCAGLTQSAFNITVDGACQNPDTANYAGADHEVSLANVDQINMVTLVNLGPKPGRIFVSGTPGVVRYGTLHNFTLTGFPAGEALVAGDFVNLYDNGGVTTVRKAFGADPDREADGYVLAPYAIGDPVDVLSGGFNPRSTPVLVKTPVWLDDGAPGGSTSTPPITEGHISQIIGHAYPVLGVLFNPQPKVIL